MFGGDRNALSQSAIRGLSNFTGAPGCHQCHLIEAPARSATFGNDKFFNTGVAAVTFDILKDQGRWKVTDSESDRGAFRPPSLRNIELTAPYMHDGNFPTVDSVVFFYAGGGRDNHWISPTLRAIGRAPGGSIPPQDLEDFLNFLRALTGEMPENAGPPE
jgi:cytochrome c peroxidase